MCPSPHTLRRRPSPSLFYIICDGVSCVTRTLFSFSIRLFCLGWGFKERGGLNSNVAKHRSSSRQHWAAVGACQDPNITPHSRSRSPPPRPPPRRCCHRLRLPPLHAGPAAAAVTLAAAAIVLPLPRRRRGSRLGQEGRWEQHLPEIQPHGAAVVRRPPAAAAAAAAAVAAALAAIITAAIPPPPRAPRLGAPPHPGQLWRRRAGCYLPELVR